VGRLWYGSGEKVVSAFSGPADANSFDMITHMPSSTTIKAKQTAERDDLEVLYQMVRIIRKSKDIYASLDPIFHRLKRTTQMTGYLLLKSRNFSKIETTLPYFKKF
jgi:hypothetical protein